MPIIEVGETFSKGEEVSEKQRFKLPEEPFDLMCTVCQATTSSKGNPQVEFTLGTQGHTNPDFNGKKLMYWAPLPHDGNNRGIGFLVDITKALGKPWDGSSLNTEDYPTRTCRANIIIDKEGYNKIKSFV